MIPVIKETPTPDWLCDIQEVTFDNQPFPITKKLENSLYYPACDIDGLPVEYLAGNFLAKIKELMMSEFMKNRTVCPLAFS